MRKIILAAGMMSLLAACGNTGNTQTIAVDDTQNYDERKADSLGIPKGNKLSAAMKRAMKWENHDNKWFFEYKMEPLKGDLAYEEGVVRRDPSAMLKIGNTYYVWYSKSYGPTQGKIRFSHGTDVIYGMPHQKTDGHGRNRELQ